MDSYLAPARQQQFELEIKRSRFITSVACVSGKSSAKTFIQDIREVFPDANHHCWAMIAGLPNDIYLHDQSDDGEPKGTAGKPMLNVLQHSQLGNTVVVVTRYFGGIKLGAGGLVRAYTQAVSGAIGQLVTTKTYITQKWVVRLAYPLLDSLEHRLASTNIQVARKDFLDMVTLELLVPKSDSLKLSGLLEEIGNGSIVIETSPSESNLLCSQCVLHRCIRRLGNVVFIQQQRSEYSSKRILIGKAPGLNRFAAWLL